MVMDLHSSQLAPWRQAVETQMQAYGLIRRLLAVKNQAQELRMSWQVDQALLENAAPFAWSSEPIRATLQASKSVPMDAQMNAWNIDSAAVWWNLEEPLPFQTITDESVPISAINIGWVASPKQVTTFPKGTPFERVERALMYGPDLYTELCIATWIRDPLKEFALIPSQTIRWKEGATLQEMLDDNRTRHIAVYGPGGKWEHAEQIGVDAFMETTEKIARFLLAGFAWLQQRVLVESVARAERHRRKEYKRVMSKEAPDVRIVSLRRADRKPSDEVVPVEGTREWTCRWTVDGHFRNQACGAGHKQHRLTWIGAYVKGPDDKPLKPSARKVYTVNR